MTLSRVATAMVIAGTLGTIVFGVWLAISIDGYELWDGWIIAAIVLWASPASWGGGPGRVRVGRDPSGELAAAAQSRARKSPPRSERRAASGSTSRRAE